MAVLRRARDPDGADGLHTGLGRPAVAAQGLPGVVRIPLPAGNAPDRPGAAPARVRPRLADGRCVHSGQPRPRCCCHSYGLLDRRLRVTGNEDSDRLPLAPRTPPGPGRGLRRRPVPDGDLLGRRRRRRRCHPGVYHYSSPHHAMERLLAGDVTAGCARPSPRCPDRPVPAGQREVLEERLQVQQLQLSRRDHGPRRAARLPGSCGPGRAGCRCAPALWFDERRGQRAARVDEAEERVGRGATALERSAGGRRSADRPLGPPAVAQGRTGAVPAGDHFPQVEAGAPGDRPRCTADRVGRPRPRTRPSARAAVEALPPPDSERLDLDLGDVLRAAAVELRRLHAPCRR